MERKRLEVKLLEDRNAVVKVLVSNGYTVRIVSEKADGKKTTFIEYWREGNAN